LRKALLFTIHFLVCFLLSITTANSAILKQGEYLEKNQWGALEDILSDWRASKITTEECALYGCYVLALQEPSKTNRNEIIKKLPSKYKIDKKSIDAAPYFFIRFLYENEEKLGEAALNEFRSSDWSDYEFWNKFKNNEKIIKLVKKTQPKCVMLDYLYRDIYSISEEIIENSFMNPDEVYVVLFMIIFPSDFNKLLNRHQDFLLKYNIGHNDAFLLCYKFEYIKNSHSRKAINITNFMNYIRQNSIKFN